jgi:hypothetical protein
VSEKRRESGAERARTHVLCPTDDLLDVLPTSRGKVVVSNQRVDGPDCWCDERSVSERIERKASSVHSQPKGIRTRLSRTEAIAVKSEAL